MVTLGGDVSWADAITAVAAVVAVLFSAVAWFTSANALKTSYRPVVRVIPIPKGELTLIDPDKLLLKNIGFGPAVNGMLFDHPTAALNAQPLGQAPLIEKAAEIPPKGDTKHGGYVVMKLSTRMQNDCDYRLLCQDIAGRWHETRFTFRESDVLVQWHRPHRWWNNFDESGRIPNSARTRVQVVRPLEGIE